MKGYATEVAALRYELDRAAERKVASASDLDALRRLASEKARATVMQGGRDESGAVDEEVGLEVVWKVRARWTVDAHESDAS
jgi:hypothetical protein